MPFLNNHRLFHATSRDALGLAVASHMAAIPARMPRATDSLDVVANRSALPSSHLWWSTLRTGACALEFPESDMLRVQIPCAGTTHIALSGMELTVAPGTAAVFAGAATASYDGSYEHLVWRVPTSLLLRKLSAHTGEAISGGIAFAPTIDLASAGGRSFERVVRCLAETANDAPDGLTANVLTELEQASVMALLCSGTHNQRHRLDGEPPGAAPWQVRRVESFIEANWTQPLTIEDIVAVSGASARSIFRTFARFRGYSPMQFLKQIRLRHARRMLRAGGPDTTVLRIALDCGFVQPGRFSREFTTAFGERPSAVLRAARHGGSSDRRLQ